MRAIEETVLNSNNDSQADKSITNTKKEQLSTGDRIKNTVIGACLGLAAGGALVATGGVFVGATAGVGATYLGVTALQGFAIGSLAVDFVAFGVLPLFGIAIEPIEYETPSLPPI